MARLWAKVLGIGVIAVFFTIALMQWPLQLVDDKHMQAVVMSTLFLAGLVLLVVEDHVNVNKAAIMLMVSTAMWIFLAVSYHPNSSREGREELEHELARGVKDVGSIILFLLPAMGVVESIDHFDGFAVVTHLIVKTIGKRKDMLMPVLCVLTFFLSAIIDNLTATIVSLKILRNVAGDDRHLRHTIGGLMVIAANAGGVWSPIGDVTTTMLWLQDKISVTNTLLWLFVPSLVAAVVPLLGLCWQTRRAAAREQLAERQSPVEDQEHGGPAELTYAKVVVLCLGLACILMVPALKMATGLPPYMGMLLALGIIWFVTDTKTFRHLVHLPEACPEQEEGATPHTPVEPRFGDEGVSEALHKMDLTGLLFFAGVLLVVGALNTAGVLRGYADLLIRICGNRPELICTLLGMSSAVVDNVPLVQAAITMFADTPIDDPLWQLVALAAGTGGSLLSVGSIAGVTFMTMEGVGYVWYCRRVSFWAATGFGLGLVTFQLERLVFT